jgi:uncharacterized membrane protein YphA (DoxX/SURF4 family)|tara:strand:- start:148 stop:549 length:402 start_codon:yes stop_codon:yes gene_type:complete
MFEYSIIHILQVLIALFLGIAMTQSGFDKIIDWKGNKSFLIEHFSKTFLSQFITPLLLVVLILELAGGIICFIGVGEVFIYNNNQLIKVGLIIIAIDLISLFFGQRLAKDYDGAAVLVNYFILTIIGLLTFTI